ncbi:hypothetical protein [Methanolobus chelungpuianus]|uniref:Uncharacterized protein n=1 Tax=Methanolobus chelungpuianus TaxID=502115 RepID=A0AAE3KY32_9EURY|nr:hypothetical protein [Methanolobus chelungpuianus]MCQ6963575.1 hypothetical protein [Methanolobus chelungpuianus]
MKLDGWDFSKKDKNGKVYCSKEIPPESRSEAMGELTSRQRTRIPKLTGRKIIILFAILIVTSMAGFSGDYNTQSNYPVRNMIGPSHTIDPVKASGEPVTLINNESSTDPTWNELISFLKTDGTDRILYQDETYVSFDFAERLHNNAEKEGIRAAFVVVDFYDNNEVHALNAFETTDKGLTYVDCTGSVVKLQELDSFDKIAYVQKGKKYGLISIYYTDSPEYSFYESKKSNLRPRGLYENKGYVYNINIYWDSILS